MSKRTLRRNKQGLPPEAITEVAARFRLLGAPSRLRILDALMGGPLSAAALGAATGLEQSNLSRQVAALERGGCVRTARVGRSLVVEIVDPTLHELCGLVCGALRDQAKATSAALRAR